ARFGLEKEWLEDAYHHPDSVITLSSKSSWQLFLSGAAPRYLRADSMFLKTRLAKDSRPFFLINIVPFFLETDSVLQATFRSSDSVFEIAQNTNTTRGPSFGLIFFIIVLLSAALLAGLSLRADIRENDSAGIISRMLSILAAIIAVFAPAAPLAVAEPNWLEFCLLIPAFTAALAGAIIFKSTIQNHEGSLKISVKLTLCSISFYIGYAALLTKSLLSSLIIAGIAAIIFLISWRFRNKPAK
ncbi:MAG TPA: hypothetical protein VMD74_00745, partial [Candidatus Methylomirabilis sp.]|nr:hypothetical protein [Candidatus Methylomirabilis sp.]